MPTRFTPFVALVILSTAMLAGCGLIPTGSPSIDADDIADTAEDALKDEFDARYKVDCGDDEVALEEDEELDCTATNRSTDLEYDATVTITDVSGAKYEIEVELAEEANNADEVDPEEDDPSDDPSDSPDSDGVTVSAEDFAEVVVDGLAGALGYEPTDLECLSSEVEIFDGNVEYCFFTDEDGKERGVEATVDNFDDSTGSYEVYSEVVY